MCYTPNDESYYDYTDVELTKKIDLTVKRKPQVQPPAIQWPTAGDITYGQSLSESELSGGDANGTFAWETPDVKPNAGTHSFTLVYTPNEPGRYPYSESDLKRDIPLTVHRAQAVIDVSGVPTQYVYTGAEQTVTGATLNHAETTLSYANHTFTDVPEGGKQTVTISAAETANYTSATATVEITVSKATAPNLTPKASAAITYGQKLSEVALNGGNGLGSFDWADGSIAPTAGTHTFDVVFTPSDTRNYEWPESALKQRIEVTVQPKFAVLSVKSATKAYGAADPAVDVSTTGVLSGDTLNYTVSRAPGEAVGRYAYSVELGANPNYRIDLAVGALNIEARSIADEGIQITGLDDQTYTGKAIRPKLTLRFGDETLVEGTDYDLSYDNNVNPGRATVTITGKGNYAGSLSRTFDIVEAKATESPEEKRARAIRKLLEELFECVYDAEYQPKDYERIPVMEEDEERLGSLLISAAPDESGAYEQRSLILNLSLLKQLQQLLPEEAVGELIFENGDVAARLALAELTGGDMAKLMNMILSGEEITEETLNADWSLLEEVELTAEACAQFDVEVRIVPTAAADGTEAFEISVWLCWNDQVLNVSGLLKEMNVCLSVNHLITDENADAFPGLYAIAWQSAEEGSEATQLESTLRRATTDQLGLTAATTEPAADDAPVAGGSCALSATYAGDGLYWVQATGN